MIKYSFYSNKRHRLQCYKLSSDNGPFPNCQSWSFITVHCQFLSNSLGLYCPVTIWPRKHKRKTHSQAFTRSKQIYRFGRSLKFCGTVHSTAMLRFLFCCNILLVKLKNYKHQYIVLKTLLNVELYLNFATKL